MNITPLELAVEEFKALASNMSYFNAAEGSSWSDESEARKSCCKKLKAASRKVLRLGGDTKALASGYLISTGDYWDKLLTSDEIRQLAEDRAAGSKYVTVKEMLKYYELEDVIREENEINESI